MPSPVGFVSLNPRLFIDFSCGKVRGMRLTRPSGRPYSYALRLKSESSPPKKFKKILQIPKISLPLHRKSKRADSVAQLVEQMTLNHWVESSSLSGVTKPNGKIKQIAETKTVSAIFVMSLSGRIKHIVGFRGVQFVNSRNREQFVHDDIAAECNFLIFCIFLRFISLKVGPICSPQGSKPHFSDNLS